ncbi:mediator of RNA polymerase II transcription subunit 14 [Biomphalaria pfeifferi]|uniref:Mediator of RNA polymerase II transcription subunit 14 n=1 Tax=Biomphalaria pfeifferi TaxID=112525 RepID=A0AAD8EXW4_BIOPF|nr:mediator of RNA polymerase II transcription subunit 14 [Biomphalaria pfeifferi]
MQQKMTPQGGMMMGVAPPPLSSGNTISLSSLIDYALQRTHHELIILSELLPRKSDMERKIEIFQFASRTRQLFVRLLALVKWANSASKVDKCMDICNFLEQQSMYFVETADSLHKMAKETLASARLPSFSLPCAIDVLTTGTYPRLPTCIRERIIPPDPITPQEKTQTLQRLNEVIQYRLVSNELPKQMRRLKIDQGRVKFFVEQEFEVTLTLMGDSPTIPWRLLDVSFLVEDHETGHGKSLVHSMQVHYIHELVQSRLLHVDHPLHDLYKVLHSFCQSLQLEVLHSQAQRLMLDRLRDSISIVEYSLSKSLSISYWRDQQKKKDNLEHFPIHKLSVHVNEEDEGKPLQISHTPPMSTAESRKVGLAIKSDHLSIEKLLMHTIEVRTHSKLKELARELQKLIDGKCEVRDMPVALHVSVLNPCMTSEVLRISIDVQTGAYMASVPSCDRSAVQGIEDSLNGEHRGLEKLLMKLKVQLVLQRCEKCVQLMTAHCRPTLPLINATEHTLNKLAATRLYVRVPKQQGYYVVVEVKESEHRKVEVNYYMLETTQCTADGLEDDIGDEAPVKAFMKAGQLTPIDTYSLAHSQFCKIFDGIPLTMDSLTRKRKIFLGEDIDEPDAKKMKGSPYFVSELAYLLARCEEKMPFVFLGEELSKQGISHDGGTLDSTGTCLSLGILYFPEVLGLPEEVNDGLRKQLLQCKFRIQNRLSRLWILEFIFNRSPLPSIHIKESGQSQRVCYALDMNGDNIQKTVSDLIDEWTSIAYLYGAVHRFADSYNMGRTSLASIVEVQSYNYKKLTLAYGPNMCSLLSVKWKPATRRFELTLGTRLPSASANPHIPLLLQLTEEFNLHCSLSQLSQTLHDTWTPMMSISKLPSAAVLGASTNTRQHIQNFTIIPQSSSHVRLVCRGSNCIDVHFRGNKTVAVKDGACSLFDTSKPIEGLQPTAGLKAFLSMFVDEGVTMGLGRRQSATADDNPPSPLDPSEIFSSQQSTGSPLPRPTQPQARQESFRFHSPMTPPSNPHTPASPGNARLLAGVNPSPSTTLMGTPSPGTLLTANSPGNPQLHVPSPGPFAPVPSPQSMVGLHMQSPVTSFMSGIVDGGSPFPVSSLAMPSPGAVRGGWVGSPSVQDPSPMSQHAVHSPGHPALHSPQMHKDGDHKPGVVSMQPRMLPQRAWAAAIPTILSHKGFDNLLTPTPDPQQGSVQHSPASPLERFFACIIMKKHFSRLVNTESMMQFIPSTEPGVLCFKVDTLQYRLSLNTTTSQSLHMKISPVPEHQDKWMPEELQILEKFFDLKVFCPPYRLNALTAVGRIISAPCRILKDCIQIMKLELIPDRSMKWTVQWCLTIPPSLHFISPVGVPAFVVKTKMIFMLQLTRIGLTVGPSEQSFVVPLLYEMQTNKLTRVEQKIPQMNNTPSLQAVSTMLNRFADHYQQQNHSNECAILPAVKELLTNLVVPV